MNLTDRNVYIYMIIDILNCQNVICVDYGYRIEDEPDKAKHLCADGDSPGSLVSKNVGDNLHSPLTVK